MNCCSKSALSWIIVSVASLALLLAVIAFFLSASNPGIQVELADAAGGTIPDGTNVLFDTVLNDQSNFISYDPLTGEFTVTRLGNYNVAWWVAVDGAGLSTTVDLAVAVNGVPYSIASSPTVTQEIAANALVTIDAIPATISLVNVTGDDMFIPDTTVQAGMVITR